MATAENYGNDRVTGEVLTGLDHLKQSINDIIFTPIGSCVMRRNYGSLVSSLIDSPANNDNLIKIYAALAHALAIWEPRLTLSQVLNVTTIEESKKGSFRFEISGDYLGDKVSLEVAR